MERDIRILRDGSICKFFKSAVLNEEIEWFNENHFEVVEMDARNWNGKNIHKNLKEALNFPDYYGENLDAFDDCIDDKYNERYKGLVLAFRHYDNFIEEDKEFGEAILDILACKSREWLVFGRKLIVLLQSDNPDLELSKLGGISPSWNGAEWFDKDRTV